MKKSRIHIVILTALYLCTVNTSVAQKGQPVESRYNVKWYIDGPITAVAFVTNFIGLQQVNSKSSIDSQTIADLEPGDVNEFDRGAISQDAGRYEDANKFSDIVMYSSFGLPALLYLDPKIRPEILEVWLMYLETEAVVGNLYSWLGARYTDRLRPVVYNPDVPFSEKKWGGNRNSFYSGHVASTAAATFFMAKVFDDFHPELENKKYWLYLAAALPPATVGVYRYQAGKHFPTDILAGFAVGAATGILIPQIHKHSGKKWSLVPFSGDVTGISFRYKW